MNPLQLHGTVLDLAASFEDSFVQQKGREKFGSMHFVPLTVDTWIVDVMNMSEFEHTLRLSEEPMWIPVLAAFELANMGKGNVKAGNNKGGQALIKNGGKNNNGCQQSKGNAGKNVKGGQALTNKVHRQAGNLPLDQAATAAALGPEQVPDESKAAQWRCVNTSYEEVQILSKYRLYRAVGKPFPIGVPGYADRCRFWHQARWSNVAVHDATARNDATVRNDATARNGTTRWYDATTRSPRCLGAVSTAAVLVPHEATIPTPPPPIAHAVPIQTVPGQEATLAAASEANKTAAASQVSLAPTPAAYPVTRACTTGRRAFKDLGTLGAGRPRATVVCIDGEGCR